MKNRFNWLFHNLIGHPIMGILVFIGFNKYGMYFHDWSLPKEAFKGETKSN